MSVYLDIKSRLDVRLAEAAAREATDLFRKAGDDINKGLSGSISKALGTFDGTAARRGLQSLQTEYDRTARAEEDAARRMTRAWADVEIAQKKILDLTGGVADAATLSSTKYAKAQRDLADSQAVASRASRDHVDAMVAAEAGHQKLATATDNSSAATSRAGQVWNGIGVASLAAFGGAMVETTKKAGDFQASQERLVASAGETQQNLKAVSDGILQLAGQVGYSAQDLSNGMYTVEKAGYRAGDGVTVLKSAAQLAKAENADLKEVLGGLTTSMNDFGYGADRSAEVASKMNTAVGLAKTNLQDFSSALHSVEPIAAAAHIKLEDVYGSLAQITQSGTSPDQGAMNMAHSISQLLKPTQQMREEMGQFGVDARDIQQHLGDRGYAGTVQHLSDVIVQHMNPAGQVVVDTMFKSQQATDSAKQIFDNLPPAAQAVAKSIQDGTLSYAEFRKTRGGLGQEQANELQQWVNLNNKISGYSNVLKTGQGDIQTYEQALALMTGGQDSLKTVLQLVGENAGAANDKIKAVKDTTREADGTVKGFNETQQTLNAKMADAKAAFGAAATEMGSVFVPVMTDVANVAKWVGDEMAKHPQIAHDVIDALGLMGGAWLLIKGYNIASTILKPIASGLDTLITKATTTNETLAAAGPAAQKGAAGVSAAAAEEVAAEERVQIAATDANGALLAKGGAGGLAGLAGPAALGIGADMAAHQAPEGSPMRRILSGAMMNLDPTLQPDDSGKPWYERNILQDAWRWMSHAGGGPISGSGPKGRDSVPAWLAPGEHVLTSGDVDAMGGHGNVYAFRNALHRELGGSGDPSDYGLPTDPGTYMVTPDKIQTALGYAASMQGQPYSWGGAGVGERVDCSGFMSTIFGILTGRPVPAGQRYFTTQSDFTKLGFLPGYDPNSPFNIGVSPSHMAGTLGGYNVESGGAADRTQIGGGAAGALNPQFSKHYHLPGSMSGADGYYGAPDDKKVEAAQAKISRLEGDIQVLEQKKSEETAKTKESEKLRLENELKNKQAELDAAKEQLAAAERGTFHATSGRGSSGRGSRSGSGGLQFGAPLPANFGLGKGIPGFFEWLATFAADMAIGPIEGAMLGDAIRSGQMGDMGDGSPGGYADLGDQGTPLSLAAGSFPMPSGGSGGGGGTAAPAGGGGAWTPSGGIPGLNLATSKPGSGGLYSPANTNPGLNNPAAAGIPGMNLATAGPGAPRGAAPYVPGAPLFGPPSPDQGFSYDILDKLHGQMGNLATPQHVDDPNTLTAPRDDIPRTPSGGIDYGALKQRFSGQVPLFPQAPPSSDYIKQWYSPNLPHMSTGGPTGTDTIPAWLSPGEFIMNSNATKNNLPALQWMNAGHYDVGSFTPLQPPPKPPTPPPPPKPPQGQGKPQPKLGDKPQGQPHIPVGGPSSPGPGNLAIPGGSDTQQGLATPGSATQQFGEGLPASGGIGFGGGIIGAAEGAASAAASMGAGGGGPAAGAGLGAAFQALNRTAGYIGQLGGIAAEGILSTFLPADSALSNFSNTLPGKLIAGVAGVRPGTPNSAGKTAAPLKPKEGEGKSGGGDTHVGSQFNAPITVKADNPDQFRQQMQREHSAAQAAYPMNTP